MDSNQFFKEFYSETSKIFGKKLSLFIGEEVKVYEQNWNKIHIDQLTTFFKLPIAISGLLIEHDYTGEGFICFSQKDAILMGCLLAMFGEATLNEKVASLDFREEEFDAFQEVCNQLISLIDQALAELLPQKIHLKQTKTQIIQEDIGIQQALGQFKKEKYLINFSFQLKLKNVYKADINLILPASVIAQIAGGEIEFSNIEKVIQEKPDSNIKNMDAVPSANKLDLLLINLGTETEPDFQQLLEEHNIRSGNVYSIDQLKKQICSNPIKLIIIQSNGQAAKAIDFCYKINQILGRSKVPIWLQSSDWNMGSIERAIKSGAGYLLVTPLNLKIIKKKIIQLF